MYPFNDLGVIAMQYPNGRTVSYPVDAAGSASGLWFDHARYDKLNRLETAAEGTSPNGWKQTYGYDRWGNRWLDVDPAKTFGMSTTGVANNAAWFTAKNRLNIPGGFDAAGNQTSSDPFTLSYDAENRQVEATSATMGSQSYRYDGEGRRVRKTVGAWSTYYIYHAQGQLAAEYETGTAPGNRPAPHCATCYLAVDHLGSTRALWDEAGLKARFDYLPFGEMVPGDRNNRGAIAC